VPEHVHLGWVEVVPEVPDMTRQPADDEDDDEGQDKASDLLASFHLHKQDHQSQLIFYIISKHNNFIRSFCVIAIIRLQITEDYC